MKIPVYVQDDYLCLFLLTLLKKILPNKATTKPIIEYTID